MIKQAKDYDPLGDYIKLWCPELANLPASVIQTPWKLSGEQQKTYDCVLGVQYPTPIIMVSSWEKHAGRVLGEGDKTRGNPSERVTEKKKMSKTRQKTLDEHLKRPASTSGGGWKKD